MRILQLSCIAYYKEKNISRPSPCTRAASTLICITKASKFLNVQTRWQRSKGTWEMKQVFTHFPQNKTIPIKGSCWWDCKLWRNRNSLIWKEDTFSRLNHPLIVLACIGYIIEVKSVFTSMVKSSHLDPYLFFAVEGFNRGYFYHIKRDWPYVVLRFK